METPKEYKTECPGQFEGTAVVTDGTREVNWIIPDQNAAQLMSRLMTAIHEVRAISESDMRTALTIVAQYYHIMHLPEARQNKITRAIRVGIEKSREERLRQQAANSATEFHGEIDREIETENIEAREESNE